MTTPAPKLPCCPGRRRYGRATWTLLHTMSVKYPEKPTAEDQRQMKEFMNALGTFFPCKECAGHLKSYIKAHPIDASSRTALVKYFGGLHNMVNKGIGKPQFDVTRIMERWADIDDKTGKPLPEKRDCDENEYGDTKDEDNSEDKLSLKMSEMKVNK